MMRAARLGLSLLATLVASLGSIAPLDAQTSNPLVYSAPNGAPDFAIPSGHFFTQALPQRHDGAGFAVQDGHGADLWTAFQDAGGVFSLGYPISRRFEWDGAIAQAFSGGILRWDESNLRAQLRDVAELPGKRPPAYATQAEQPPLASAEITPTPWSGWWWPDFDGVGPTLFAADSPLARYDRYVMNLTGHDPGTRTWELHNMYFPGTAWTGHCNGFAAAALLEPEPTAPRSLLGVTFSVADLKGLLVDVHFADTAAWSFGDADQLDPADFHRMLLDWMGAAQTGFVLTFDAGGGEVWSYPVYRFESAWAPDRRQDDVWHVTTTLWMADMDVPPEFVGTRPYPGSDGKVFTYDVRGDPRNPDGGVWTGASTGAAFGHPARTWYPHAGTPDAEGNLVSPDLDRGLIQGIISGEANSAGE